MDAFTFNVLTLLYDCITALCFVNSSGGQEVVFLMPVTTVCLEWIQEEIGCRLCNEFWMLQRNYCSSYTDVQPYLKAKVFIAVLNSYTKMWAKKPVVIVPPGCITLPPWSLYLFKHSVPFVWLCSLDAMNCTNEDKDFALHFCKVWPLRHLWCCAQLHIEKVMEMVALSRHDSTNNALIDGNQKQCHLQAIHPQQLYS